jgi:DNA invertase Pin-like site-specific DNA recombinase
MTPEHRAPWSRLNEADWARLKQSLNEKHIKVVPLDLPTSWMMTSTDEITARMFDAINNMMLDMLAAIARKDYTTRCEVRHRAYRRRKPNKYRGRRRHGAQCSDPKAPASRYRQLE